MSIENKFTQESISPSQPEQKEVLATTTRKAEEDDLSRIFEIEKRSYPPQLQATNEVLRYRFETFGIWVAETNKEMAGFFTCIPVKLSLPDLSGSDLERIMKNRHPKYKPWFEEYKKGGEFNTLWVTSTAVETEYQDKGVGTTLIKTSLDLAKELGLHYRASALRCQYARYFQETDGSIQDYMKDVEGGKIKDRFLGPYLKLGFKLITPLPNYEPYKGSLNYNLLAYKSIR